MIAAISVWLAQVPPGLNKSWGLLLIPSLRHSCMPTIPPQGTPVREQPPPPHGVLAPSHSPSLFSSLPPPLAFLSFTPTPLASSIHLHEYLKATTTMENMQQGQWDLSKRGKKAKCSFWDLEFPNLRQAMWWNSKWSNYRVLWRESKRENFNNTHWESDTSNSCPAGEKTGSTGGWPVGTSSWLCVCVDWLPHDRECLVCRGPCRLP